MGDASNHLQPLTTLEMSTAEVITTLDRMTPAEMYSALLYISGACEKSFMAAVRMYANAG